MKLLSSFKKELILATRSFYFYVEVLFAVVLLAVLLFAIPENFTAVQTEYMYLDMPEQAVEYYMDIVLEEDIDGKVEMVDIEADGEAFRATLVASEEANTYILDSEDDLCTLADTKQNLGIVVSLDDNNEIGFKYYLQGFESTRLKNLLAIISNINEDVLQDRYEAQEVRLMNAEYQPLNDRENTIPPMLAFNASLMGMFIMASYVFLDKKEGVIKAYAVTASSVSRYLLSKILVVMVTSVFSGLVVVMPIIGFHINYALLILLLITSGFFASVVGLLISSFYKDIAKAFGVIYFLIMLFMVPSISYFIPSWDPKWVTFIPTYPLIQAFKEIITQNGDAVYVLLASAGFLAAGVILFAATNVRFKRTLSV